MDDDATRADEMADGRNDDGAPNEPLDCRTDNNPPLALRESCAECGVWIDAASAAVCERAAASAPAPHEACSESRVDDAAPMLPVPVLLLPVPVPLDRIEVGGSPLDHERRVSIWLWF